MSTPSTVGISATPASGYIPDLTGLKLPTPLIDAITQAYKLIYSLRDTLAQLQMTAARRVQYGTHAQRVQTNPQAVPDGALFFETDNGTIFYQARLAPQQTTRQWFLAGGAAAGSLSKQPAYLGQNDAGFQFLQTGLPGNKEQLYIWTGSLWAQVN